MKLTGRLLVVSLSSLLVAPVAFAQEPPPATQPAPEATPTPTTPAPPLQVKEPGVDPDKPKTGSIDEEEQETEPEVQWGLGARSYFVFIPTWLFNLFVEHSTPMQSVTFAGSLIRRKGNFDIQFTLEYGRFNPDNGLWQEKDEDPSMSGMYPDQKVFDLGMVSVDASFIWHVDLTDFMQFRYGAGIGLGVKLGSAKGIDQVCASTTELDDLDDPNTTRCSNDPTAQFVEEDIPPVLPVINLLLGLRFKLVDQLSVNIEGGYRFPAFFVGGGIGYFF